MIEQGDLLNTKLQYKTTLKYIVRPKRSTPDNETIRERIEADMDFKIPGLPHSIVKHAQNASVRELIQKIENHQIDMLFIKTYDRINHSIPSVQNQNK